MQGWKKRGQEKQNRNSVNSNRLASKKQGDANPAIVNFFLSPETDADISIYSFSSFRLLVKSLLVAKQQQQVLYISIRQ